MACFARPDAPNPPFVADCFAPGESVTLRPRLDWGIESEANMKGLRVPGGVDPQALSPDELNALLQQNMDAKAVTMHKLCAMIESWTLRYEPSEEQRARGEPGDIAPLEPQKIAELPLGYANAIAAEIERRGGALTGAQETGPLATTSPPSARSSSASASPTASERSPDARPMKRAS